MLLHKRIEFSGHSASVYTLDTSHEFCYTGSGDKFVAKWNLISGVQEAFSLRCDQAVYKIRLLNDKRLLGIGTSSGSFHLIDLLNKKEIKHYVQHKSAVFEILENSFKNQIYTTDADGNLAVWNSENLNLLLFLPLNCGKIRQVLCHENGSLIYLACQDGMIRILDTENFNETDTFQAHETGVNCLNIFPNKKHLLISGGKDGFLRIWDSKQGFKLILELPAHNFGIYQLEFINNGKNFVTVSRDKSIKLWDAETLRVIQKTERKHGGHFHAINALAKVNESCFLTVGDDKRVILWEIET